MAYETTSVPVSKSQEEIRKLLTKHGAAQFSFGEEAVDDIRFVAVAFRARGRVVRMRVACKPVDEGTVVAKARRSRSKTADQVRGEMAEQENRRVWRVLQWNIKARMVAVEEGLETIEEAFLAHLVTDTGATVYEQLRADGALSVEGPVLTQRLLTSGD